MVDAGKILVRGLVIIAVAGLLAMGCSAGGTALKEDASGGLAKVQDIQVKEAEGQTTVTLSLDKAVSFTSVKLSDPPMIVIDLAGVDLGDNKGLMDVGKDPVLYINPSRDAVSKRIARVEIGLTRTVSSNVFQEGNDISIIFKKTAVDTDEQLVAPSSTDNVAAADDGTAPEAVPVVVDAGENGGLAVTADNAVADEVAEADASLPDATTVQDITFAKSGQALKVVVQGDGRFTDHKAFMVGEDRLVLDIFGVGSLKDKDAIQVDGDCIKRVRMASHTEPEAKVRVVLDLACEIDYDVRDTGSDVVVAVAPRGRLAMADISPAVKPSAEQVPALSGEEKIKTGMSTGRQVTVSVPPPALDNEEKPKIYVTKKDGQMILSSAPGLDEKLQPKVMGSDDKYVVTETKIYTGGKISFDIQDADLDKVIKLLADVAGLNLIMDPSDVKGKVTLKLANVPWDQALDILLKIYNLDKVLEGNVLRVAPKKKLDEERKSDLRAIAEQKKLIEDAEDLYTKTFKVNYADAAELEGKVKKILTKRGEATANPRTNELIITDIKDKIEEAGDLINILDKEVNQILIEARIVTVDVGYSQSFGINWGSVGIQGNKPISNWAGGSGPNFGHVFDETDEMYKLAVPSEDVGLGLAGFNGVLSILSLEDNLAFDITLQALEDINKAETLAAPKVLTLENEKAEITQGTTLYVQTTSAEGTKPEPLNANLSLTVTPRVTGDNFIIMDVDATNNSASTPPPGSTASIETQAVKTNVIVKDGETIVLGGIYIKTKSKDDAGVPLLGRIPILGWLFKQRVEEESTSELLIFITPKLMKQQQPVRT